jgi:hypothetical protein
MTSPLARALGIWLVHEHGERNIAEGDEARTTNGSLLQFENQQKERDEFLEIPRSIPLFRAHAYIHVKNK